MTKLDKYSLAAASRAVEGLNSMAEVMPAGWYLHGKLEIQNENGYRIGYVEYSDEYLEFVFVADYKED